MDNKSFLNQIKIDEYELDSRAFKKSSTQWLDFDINNKIT